MRIVDAHAHFFSRPFFDTLALLSPQPGTPEERLRRVAEAAGLELPQADVEAHTERWLGELEKHGVQHMVTFASLPEEIPAVAEAVQLAAGRLTGIAMVNPRTPGTVEDLWSLLTKEGFRGILLFPAMHHFRVGGPEAETVLRECNDRGALVYVHCGLLVVPLRDRLGLPRPYDIAYANPLDVIPAANRFPRARFVIPHFGAGFFRETLMAGEQCGNILVDTSSSNRWTRTQTRPPTLKEVFARALDVFGPQRILFGTDSGTFPAGWRRERLEEQQAVLEDLGVGADDRELVFGGNARRLLGL